jgi:hypothetical protein
MIMVPIVIAASITIKETALDKLKQREGPAPPKLKPMQTVFNDSNLLIQTLREHGLSVTTISENKIYVKSGKHELHYERANTFEAFSVHAIGWDHTDQFLNDLACLENEYKMNVQSYSYDKLLQNLNESGMTLESETVLEDNSILLTIAV